METYAQVTANPRNVAPSVLPRSSVIISGGGCKPGLLTLKPGKVGRDVMGRRARATKVTRDCEVLKETLSGLEVNLCVYEGELIRVCSTAKPQNGTQIPWR